MNNSLVYDVYTVRSAAILTTSYVAGTVIGVDLTKLPIYNGNQLILYVSFTPGSLTSAEIFVEFSPDNTNWYPETSASISSGVSTDSIVSHTFGTTAVNGNTNRRIPIQITDRYIRVSAKGTGTVTASSMAISAVIGRN